MWLTLAFLSFSLFDIVRFDKHSSSLRRDNGLFSRMHDTLACHYATECMQWVKQQKLCVELPSPVGLICL